MPANMSYQSFTQLLRNSSLPISSQMTLIKLYNDVGSLPKASTWMHTESRNISVTD